MTAALIDTNVVLDVLLDRSPFVADSGAVWRACDAGQFHGFVSGFTLPTIFHVVRQTRGRGEALRAVDVCLDAFHVTPLDRDVIRAARLLNGRDFEDDLQIAGAVADGLDCIVTRDPRDYAGSSLPVLSPTAFLARIASP